MKCPNCNEKITCGCQKRTAADGKQCCAKCVHNYNKQVKTSS